MHLTGTYESIWITYTTSDAEKWHVRLATLVKNAGYLFICKLDITSRQGWRIRNSGLGCDVEKPEA